MENLPIALEREYAGLADPEPHSVMVNAVEVKPIDLGLRKGAACVIDILLYIKESVVLLGERMWEDMKRGGGRGG
jgi:hypothetical protein